MVWRKAHGRAAKLGKLAVIETCPVDELPAGAPGPARPEATRDPAGRFMPGPGTKALARSGGRAAAESRQLAQLLGLWEAPEDHPYAPYAKLAREWRDSHMATLAATVAGGEVGPGPAAIVSTAAMQLGASRWAYDQGARTGDAALLATASRLGDASRQSLMTAHELAAREARARPATDPHARLLEAFGEPEPETATATSELAASASEQGSRDRSTLETETRSDGEYDVTEGGDA